MYRTDDQPGDIKDTEALRLVQEAERLEVNIDIFVVLQSKTSLIRSIGDLSLVAGLYKYLANFCYD